MQNSQVINYKEDKRHYFLYQRPGCTIEGFVEEDLEPLVQTTLRCGNKKTFQKSYTVGVASKMIHEFESSVGASVGDDSIAQIKSEIKSKTGIEVSLSRESQISDTLEFASPECGEKYVLYCRKKIIITMYITKNGWRSRLLGLPNLTTKHVIEERTAQHEDLSTQISKIKACGCADDKAPEEPLSGNRQKMMVEMGKLSKLISVYEDHDGIWIPELGIRLRDKKLADLLNGYIQTPTASLPNDFVANSGINPFQPNIAMLLRGLTTSEERSLLQKQEEKIAVDSGDITQEAGKVELLPLLFGITCGLTVSVLLATSRQDQTQNKAGSTSKNVNDLALQLRDQLADTISKISKKKNAERDPFGNLSEEGYIESRGDATVDNPKKQQPGPQRHINKK